MILPIDNCYDWSQIYRVDEVLLTTQDELARLVHRQRSTCKKI